jgi:hypothetical protein
MLQTQVTAGQQDSPLHKQTCGGQSSGSRVIPGQADDQFRNNHAPGIVECPNGDLLVSWYRGSGECRADEVAVYGARVRTGPTDWSDWLTPPGFPDCNTVLFIDARKRLWLFWWAIVDNTWESCLNAPHRT